MPYRSFRATRGIRTAHLRRVFTAVSHLFVNTLCHNTTKSRAARGLFENIRQQTTLMFWSLKAHWRKLLGLPLSVDARVGATSTALPFYGTQNINAVSQKHYVLCGGWEVFCWCLLTLTDASITIAKCVRVFVIVLFSLQDDWCLLHRL